jgi:hypothetical protein
LCNLSYFCTADSDISKKLKLRLKNTMDKALTYASETWMLRKRDRKQINVFERKMYRILCPVYGSEKENWRKLTNKEFMQLLKNLL